MMDLYTKLNSLQEVSKVQLSKILSIVPKQKYLVLESCIIRPLERVCGVKWLKDNGVEKIFKLEATAPNFAEFPVFFMIFSKFDTFKQVVDQIRSRIDQEHPPKNMFHIIVVPRFLSYYENELEELGLIHTVIRLHSFQWFPFHIDKGILSLELPQIYKTLFLELEFTYLPILSKALWKLFFVTGRPKLVLVLGEYANKIVKQVDTLIEDQGDTDKHESDFGAAVIIDRNLDYPSALLTPGTYTALLNEVYGIKCGVCEWKTKEAEESNVDGEGRLNPTVKKQPVHFAIDSNQDAVYADIKNRYFTEVTAVLSSLTKQLKTEKQQSTEMALDEIKRYVQTQLQATKSRKKFISNHLNAAETIINVLGPQFENMREFELNIIKNTNRSANLTYLDESLVVFDDKFTCLRLFCLLCLTQKMSENEMKSFWRKYLHQFGYVYGIAHKYLINANIILESTTPNSGKLPLPKKLSLPPMFTSKEFYLNATKFKQIPPNSEKINLKFPTCASYVFGGIYIPLITQISSMLLNATPVDEIKGKLGGLGPVTLRNDGGFPLLTRSVLVYVIGGVTYGEIAACNLLETMTGSRIIIMSDRIITGSDLIKDMLE